MSIQPDRGNYLGADINVDRDTDIWASSFTRGDDQVGINMNGFMTFAFYISADNARALAAQLIAAADHAEGKA